MNSLLKGAPLAGMKVGILAILLCPAIGLAQSARVHEQQRIIAELQKYARPDPLYLQRNPRRTHLSGVDRAQSPPETA